MVFDGCKVEDNLHMDDINVSEEFHFAAARVTRNLFFSGATLDATTLFIYTEIGESAVFGNCSFLRKAWFDHTKIGGPVNFDRARFAKEANFDYLDVHGNAWLRGTTFNGPLSMKQAGIGGTLDFGTKPEGHDERNSPDNEDSPGRTAFAGAASFVGVTVQGNANFRDAQFASGVSFDGATIGGSAPFERATFHGPARFVAARVSGDVRLDQCKFWATATLDRLIANGFITCRVTQFMQSASFAGARAHEGLSLVGTFFFGEVTFRNTMFDSVIVAPEKAEDATTITPAGRSVEVKAYFKGSIDLRGLTYNALIPWEKWTELIEQMSPYDRQPFVHLEELFRRRGLNEVADRIYYKRRTREFQLFKKRRPLAFLTDRFLWFLTG